ncbi:MAG: nucleotide exchange factor GrpE [Beggiatoa sp. IS2]|nr:MAG: nucleotide exchange factor GrpE [Beggiatoa sp. IS2]
MGDEYKEDLLGQFRVFLETQPPPDEHEIQQTDLFSLYSELATLRTEIKLESRQFKATLDLLKSVVDTHQVHTDSELQQYRKEQITQRREIMRALLLDFLEIRDRLEAAKGFFNKYQIIAEECAILANHCEQEIFPSRWKRFFHREVETAVTVQKSRVSSGLQKGLNSLKNGLWKLGEGQAITLRRLDQTLNRYRVQPFETLHKTVDPHTMRVIEIDKQPQLEEGIVTEEIRKGFLWEDEVLRLAEVKVNKLSDV